MRDAQIEDIARAVGVNRAIIYRHFSGKEELFALTLVGYLDELEERLRRGRRAASARRVAAGRGDRGVRRLRPRVPRVRRLRPDPDAPPRARAARGDQRGRAVPPRPRHLGLPRRSSATSSTPASTSGDFHVDDSTLLANHMYASGLGALQLARVGMLVKESAPGIPAIAPVSPDQVKVRRRDAALATGRRRVAAADSRRTGTRPSVATAGVRLSDLGNVGDRAGLLLQDRGDALAAGGADRDQRRGRSPSRRAAWRGWRRCGRRWRRTGGRRRARSR